MHTLLTLSVRSAAEFLNKQEIIAFPTETVYGLAGRIDSEKALNKIFQAKGRPADNPLIVHIYCFEQLSGLAENLNPNALKLIENFWPGPLTLILEGTKQISPLINAGLGTIAVRQPKHQMALELIEEVGIPLAAPSANLSGKPSGTLAKHILEDFDGLIPCILDGGATIHGLESTVVNCQKPEEINILRLGSIPFEALQEVIPNIKINNNNKSASPGLKYKHYAPRAQVQLINCPKEINSFFECAYIGFEPAHQNIQKQKIINSNELYAAVLFAFFRECDEMGFKTIFCQMPQPSGLGLTLIDRLLKASSH